MNWEELKEKEKHIHSATEAMQAVPQCFPSLMRAGKLQKRAAATGFDMDASAALSAVTEAAERIRTEYADSADKDTLYLLAEELLFAAVYVMRALGLDVPPMTDLAHSLRADGVDVRADVLTVDEMVEEVCRLSSNI